MREHLQELIEQSLLALRREEFLPRELDTSVEMERTRDEKHGEFACNIALKLAKPLGKNPREIAEAIVERIPESRHVEKIELAGPGFINFFITTSSLQSVVATVLKQGDDYGCCNDGEGQSITVEFVSANPTGPLHVGHGRGAAYGSSLSNILVACGFNVQREYYVNDAGRQMDILATSVWLRYLELCGVSMRFPDNAYRGDYIYDIAREVRQHHGDTLRVAANEVLDELPDDQSDGGDKELYIDAMINRCKSLLGEDRYQICFGVALEVMVNDIRDDLAGFNVTFDHWFSEKQLADNGDIAHVLEQLQAEDWVYRKDGALWFKASELGDEKDRVVVREDGRTTYFTSDIAYMLNKIERGFDRAIYAFGADHHGYVARLKAAAQALSKDPDFLEIPLIQFATLMRNGEKQQMGSRSGQFVSLRELREEVGTDAARFFYVMRSHEQHVDFDLELAKEQSRDNPVFYVQYAQARICRMFRKLEQAGRSHNEAIGSAALDQLTADSEMILLQSLTRFPEAVAAAGRNRTPHVISYYLRDLAQCFSSYYHDEDNVGRIIEIEDDDLRNARLNLCHAVRIVLRNGLALIGVSAPQSM